MSEFSDRRLQSGSFESAATPCAHPVSADLPGQGLQWTNLAQAAIPGDNVTPLEYIITMLSSCVLTLVLMLYLDAVVPWQYGMPKHPLFFLQKSFWVGESEESMHLLSTRDSSKGQFVNGSLLKRRSSYSAQGHRPPPEVVDPFSTGSTGSSRSLTPTASGSMTSGPGHGFRPIS